MGEEERLTTPKICKHKGANVIATTSTKEKAELAKENGAHHVLLTTASSEENVKAIKDLTGGKGVHVVYDGVGKDTFDEDFEVVRPKGTLVMYGNASVSDTSCAVSCGSSLKECVGRPGRLLGTPTHAEESQDHATNIGHFHQHARRVCRIRQRDP